MSAELPESLISPNYGAAKLDLPTIEDLVDVFEDRVTGWLFSPIRALLPRPSMWVPALGLSLTYFEPIASYRRGEESHGASGEFFREGFVDVFRSSEHDPALLDRIASVLYQDARCGFFHDAMLRDRIYVGTASDSPLHVTVPLRDGAPDPEAEIQSVLIELNRFMEYVEGHFTSYLARLRDSSNVEEREAFSRACEVKWLAGPKRHISL